MYNVDDTAGRKVDYLRLSPRTIARIFMGDITPLVRSGHRRGQRRRQPAAARPAHHRRLPRRAVGHDGALLRLRRQHRARRRSAAGPPQPAPRQQGGPHHPARRAPAFAPQDPRPQRARTRSPSTSPAARANGRSATTSSATPCPTARQVGPGPQRRRASGCCPTPRTSRRRSKRPGFGPDLTQELSPASTPARTREAYPISAYSYMVTQCAPAARPADVQGQLRRRRATADDAGPVDAHDRLRRPGEHGPASATRRSRPTCRRRWPTRSAACRASPPEQLNAGNCGNPRFKGNDFYGEGADPLRIPSSRKDSNRGASAPARRRHRPPARGRRRAAPRGPRRRTGAPSRRPATHWPARGRARRGEHRLPAIPNPRPTHVRSNTRARSSRSLPSWERSSSRRPSAEAGAQ